MTLGLPTFAETTSLPRWTPLVLILVSNATLPFFQYLLCVSGFTEEAEKAEQAAGAASLSDRFLDAVCPIGPVTRCRERLAVFTAAGLDLPILVPPIGVEGARTVINTFRL